MSGALTLELGHRPPEPARWPRWAACAALAVAAHLAIAWVLTSRPEPPRPASAPEAAVLVDLAPPPAPPPAPSVDLPPPELPLLAPELTPPEPQPEPPPPEPVLELPLPELPPPPELPLPEPPPEVPPDAAVLPTPAPPPVKPTPPPREVVRREVVPPDAAPAPAPQAPAASPAPSQPQAAAAAPPSYQGLLLRHLERHKRYPRSARVRREEGTAQLRFTMDRAGNVLGFQLVGSSGHESLDAEVTAMLERAAPLPPLPAEMPQAQLQLIVPVTFELR